MKKKENKRAESQEQGAMGGEQSSKFKVWRAKGRAQRAKSEEQIAKHECGTTDNNIPVSQFDNLPVSQFDNLPNAISTVHNIKTPSNKSIYIPVEGCISGSRAIKACLMIRVFNN
jgi:hypothetical protein